MKLETTGEQIGRAAEPPVRLADVSTDCADPALLADPCPTLVGGERLWRSPASVAITNCTDVAVHRATIIVAHRGTSQRPRRPKTPNCGRRHRPLLMQPRTRVSRPTLSPQLNLQQRQRSGATLRRERR